PRTVVNRVATQRIQEEVGRQAVKEASENPEFFEINHAAIIKAEERVDGTFQILSLGLKQPETQGRDELQDNDGVPGMQLTPVEVQELIANEWQIELSPDLIKDVLNASVGDFNTLHVETKQ